MESIIYANNVSELLIAKEEDLDIKNIEEFIKILNKNIEEKTEFETKICKSLELVYSIFIESYTSERVFKLTTLLNFIFNESEKHDFKSQFIGRKLKIIFTVIDKKCFLENIPAYICSRGLLTKDISEITRNVYSNVRNKLMHGKIDVFTEFAVINLEDYIPLKIISLELLKAIVSDKKIVDCKNTKEFNEYVESRENERIESLKYKK